MSQAPPPPGQNYPPQPPYPPQQPYPQQGYPPPGPPYPPQGYPQQGQPQQGNPPQMMNYGAVLCPRCRSANAKKVSFTWWGGVVGPRMFNMVKCLDCRMAYNGKTGKSLGAAIAIYTVVGLAIAIIFGIVLFNAQH